MIKRMVFGVIAVFIGFLAPLVIIEIILRFLPVAEAVVMQPLNDRNPVIRFEPNREITFSKGWDFSICNIKKINNAGFANRQDYVPDSETPLMSIIGDSYVEAFHVPDGDAMHDRLQDVVGSKGRVYSFGVSGVQLSGYLAYAKWVKETYHPDSMVFVIIGNDFDESHVKYQKSIAGYFFMPNDDGELVLRRANLKKLEGVRDFAKKSALLRYLFFTVGVDWRGLANTVLSGSDAETNYVGNTIAQASKERINDSRKVVDAFFRLLPKYSGLSPKNILFVVDGLRLYDHGQAIENENSYFAQMRNYFLGSAKSRGYKFIDMDVVFNKHYEQHGTHFEFPNDGHWNSLGHEVVAKEIQRSKVFEYTFKQ